MWPCRAAKVMHQSGAETLVTEEPYALIAHVRVCGGAGWAPAGPAFVLVVASHVAGDSGYLAWSWRFTAGVFVVTLVYLVRYVLRPAGAEGMTIDRLYGGAAAYLLIGLLWCYFYALREHFSP